MIDFTVFRLCRENQLSITVLLTLIQDIYSYNKEVDSDFAGNTVYQLQHYGKCLPHTAMALTEQMFEKEKQILDQNCAEIENKYDGNREVQRYLRSMKALATAHHLFYTNYHGYTAANDQTDQFE